MLNSVKGNKKRIFEIIEKAEDKDLSSLIFDYVILILIIISVGGVILESFEQLYEVYARGFRILEIVTVVVFSIEYGLRLWTSDMKYPEVSKKKAMVLYCFSFLALVDLFAILPFYLPFIISIDLRFIRIVRLTRIFRIFKFNRYFKSLQLIGQVMKEAKEELITTVFLMFFIILISASLMYNAENQVQPEAFPNIVASFWWSIATLTTVGYGDVYPVTVVGKILASVIAISGIGLVALPTGIISSEFMKLLSSKNSEIRCPHCGEHFYIEEKADEKKK